MLWEQATAVFSHGRNTWLEKNINGLTLWNNLIFQIQLYLLKILIFCINSTTIIRLHIKILDSVQPLPAPCVHSKLHHDLPDHLHQPHHLRLHVQRVQAGLLQPPHLQGHHSHKVILDMRTGLEIVSDKYYLPNIDMKKKPHPIYK